MEEKELNHFKSRASCQTTQSAPGVRGRYLAQHLPFLTTHTHLQSLPGDVTGLLLPLTPSLSFPPDVCLWSVLVKLVVCPSSGSYKLHLCVGARARRVPARRNTKSVGRGENGVCAHVLFSRKSSRESRNTCDKLDVADTRS